MDQNPVRMRVLGADAIGPAEAILAASRGHDVALWSPSGRGTAGIAGTLTAEGALDRTVPVRVAHGLAAALQGAEVALLTVPAYALADLLPRIAAAAPRSLLLSMAPAAALAPLAYETMRGSLGPRALVGAMATTPMTACRIAPDRVRIPGIRAAVDVAAVPSSTAAEIAVLATALFGRGYPRAPNILQPALANATRIERGEAWSQYELMTEASCRLRAGGAALAESLHRASVPRGPLHEMGQAVAATGRVVAGPPSMETRYVTEDVPDGLAFYLWLAGGCGIAMPGTEATVTLLETLWHRDLRGNALLAPLAGRYLEAMLRDGVGRCASGGPRIK
ncbi:NAD/NADP octopine/nopaline dehydrogenase family protein [Falsiroseomonas sp. E2-1-a20]|uniref:NAD/NADP octopine/nopaline dehydrogenase family protein n=1 Tax=Falsiroseomonas sp. E2-1-a20 TaxID=3239300 RepID=UPI003F3990C8